MALSERLAGPVSTAPTDRRSARYRLGPAAAYAAAPVANRAHAVPVDAAVPGRTAIQWSTCPAVPPGGGNLAVRVPVDDRQTAGSPE
ncbi:hypothetical protein ACFVXQ_26100, partial [Kitasatospora sp. NPDC058263]